MRSDCIGCKAALVCLFGSQNIDMVIKVKCKKCSKISGEFFFSGDTGPIMVLEIHAKCLENPLVLPLEVKKCHLCDKTQIIYKSGVSVAL